MLRLRNVAKSLSIAGVVLSAALPVATQAREGHRGEREGRGGRCALTIASTSPRIVEGEPLSVLGKLVCPQPADAGEQLVTVYRLGGGTGKTVQGTATTLADGSYQLAIPTLEANSILSVRARHSSAARTVVKVAPKIVLDGPAPGTQLAVAGPRARTARARPTFTGSVGAAYAGAPVTLQTTYVAASEQWRDVAFGHVDAQGDYSLAHGFRTPGETWVRVVVHARHGKAPAASDALSYQVVSAQNPDLTIQSSSPQVAFGQPVTISGVAAATAQTVALLARRPGTPFQQVETATTDEAGGYTFTATPQQNTYYEVRDASASSIALFEGVSYLLTPDAPPTTAVAGQAVAFTGTLAPAPAGQPIELERQNASGIGFHVVATGVLDGSHYSIAQTFANAGSYTLRLKAAAGVGTQATATAPFTLQVAPTAQSLLTSPEPAPPLSTEEREEDF